MIRHDLEDARARTLALVSDLSEEQVTVPMLETINPFLWEIGHVAYFAEFWTLRHIFGEAPILTDADALYDSAKIPHDSRWSLPLPDRAGTLAFMRTQLQRLIDHVDDGAPRSGGGTARSEAAYFYRLALLHEDMHGEALVYARQSLAYSWPLPAGAASSASVTSSAPAVILSVSKDAEPVEALDARIPAGTYRVGSTPEDGFVFDNEKWAHDIELEAFEIGRAPITNAQFRAFVDGGGYRNRDLWTQDGWAWRRQTDAEHPVYWEGSMRRHFDRLVQTAR